MRRHSFLLLTLFAIAVTAVSGCGNKKATGGGELPEAKYIRDNATSVFVFQVNKALNSELAGLLPEEAMSTYTSGFNPKHIDRLIIAMTTFEDIKKAPPGVGVVTFTADADLTKIRESLPKEGGKQVAGKTYYALPGAQGVFGYFNESERVVVVGSEEELKKALAGGATSKLVGKITENLDQHVYIYMDFESIKDGIDKFAAMPGSPLPPQAKAITQQMKGVKTFELMVDLSGSNLLQARVSTESEEGATTMKQQMDQSIAFGKTAVAGLSPQGANGPSIPGLDLAQETLESIRVEGSGNEVTISIPRPDDLVNRLKPLTKSARP